MKQISRHEILNRIAVSRDAFLHLFKLSRAQRGCKPLTDEQLEIVWKRRSKDSGSVILDDHSLGGGDGTYYGKWNSWSCADLKNMLKDAGLSWDDLEPIEHDVIDVYI